MKYFLGLNFNATEYSKLFCVEQFLSVKIEKQLLKNSKLLQEVYVVGGHISINAEDKGNVFSVPSNQYAEFNMFLDPLAAKIVFESDVNITLIPLSAQRRVSSFPTVIATLRATRKTPEALFSKCLLSTLDHLKQINNRYHHMV
jgi:inosine-uridine nucleoside N-ribohydrolase